MPHVLGTAIEQGAGNPQPGIGVNFVHPRTFPCTCTPRVNLHDLRVNFECASSIGARILRAVDILAFVRFSVTAILVFGVLACGRTYGEAPPAPPPTEDAELKDASNEQPSPPSDA